ncbi:MAG TPA: Gfo/Idh/MocA family oxidoreductase [Solirubrobacteraceae bacterium]|nr:Gfo/Idh/MocA family oxidoreductase [Solirubrobacteraceae bacterium]
MSESKTPRKALIAGLGHMGSNHARVLGQIEGVEIVALVDPEASRRERFERRHPGATSYSSIEQALESVAVDFACLSAPAEKLPALGNAAVEAGVAVLVEKPLAADEQEAFDLVREAERRRVLLGVNLVERCNPAVLALKEHLDAGSIGRIYQMHARRLSPFPDRDGMLGVALDLASHDIDVMRYLTGSEVGRVFAESAQRLHDRAEDLIAATMRFDNDTTGLLEVNWLTPTKVRELTVTGEGGTFVLNYLTQELYHYGHPTEPTDWDTLSNMRGAGEGDMIRYALARREPLVVQWEAFLAALDGHGRPLADGHDGYAALSTARAIQRSGVSHETAVPGYREQTPAG